MLNILDQLQQVFGRKTKSEPTDPHKLIFLRIRGIMFVTSELTCREKRTTVKQTTAVMPTAMMTVSVS